jgi:DNA-binding transcriptional ArsR family regulator
MNTESYFIEKIMEQLSEINTKLDKIVASIEYNNGKILEEGSSTAPDNLDVLTLLSLPDHLRTTARSLYDLGVGNAEDVSKITGKERAVESNYLNQLERMGYVEKLRKGRKVYFKIK